MEVVCQTQCLENAQADGVMGPGSRSADASRTKHCLGRAKDDVESDGITVCKA